MPSIIIVNNIRKKERRAGWGRPTEFWGQSLFCGRARPGLVAPSNTEMLQYFPQRCCPTREKTRLLNKDCQRPGHSPEGQGRSFCQNLAPEPQGSDGTYRQAEALFK